eukprot:2757983-Heterocapsa_arctica.AAC.1
MENDDSDRTDHDSDGDYPGHRVRKEAYCRMIENHKDNIFQKREEAEAIRKRKNRKMNHDSDKQEVDKVHRYVQEGLLQRVIKPETNMADIEVTTEQKEHNQHKAGEIQEEESCIETQKYWHTAGETQDGELYTEEQIVEQFEPTQATGDEQDEQNAQYFQN